MPVLSEYPVKQSNMSYSIYQSLEEERGHKYMGLLKFE